MDVSTFKQNDPAEAPVQEQRTRYADTPPQVYEITWLSGHVEMVAAHQVSWPNNVNHLFGRGDAQRRVQFHAEVDGLWTLMLSALEDDIRTIRNITAGETILPGGAA